jgi:uncharacterized protein (DUF488 family)
MHTSQRCANFYTLGYQSHTLLTLLDVLSANNVGVLVDVRQNPVSRKRGFSKSLLEESIRQSGIDYFHTPDLGTPPAIRNNYLKSGNIKNALKEYEKHLRARRQCLRSLLRKVSRRTFCLLCLESDYTSCHRSVIARVLKEMTGCQPIHLK